MQGFFKNKNEGFEVLVSRDTRLTQMGQVKVFDKAIATPIAVTQTGYVAIYQPAGKKQIKGGLLPKFEDVPETLIVLHFDQITDYDLLVDNKSGMGGALAGAAVGSIFGLGGGGAVVGQAIGSGKAKSIDLQIKTTDFNNPQIIVPLFPTSTEKAAGPWSGMVNAVTGSPQKRKEEIQELLSQFDNLWHTYKSAPTGNVVVQQTSDADELAKYKKLLDDGVINQDEFNAKKKQILGL